MPSLPSLIAGFTAFTIAACGISVVGTTENDASLTPDSSAEGAAASLPAASGDAEVESPTVLDEDAAVLPEEDSGSSSSGGVDASNDGATTVDAATDSGTTAPPAYSLGTTGGATFVINASMGGACSGSGAKTTLRFVNDGKTAYRRIWVRADCTEADYGTLAPNQSITYTSYVNHRWRLRRTSDNSLLVDFTLKTAGSYMITVH